MAGAPFDAAVVSVQRKVFLAVEDAARAKGREQLLARLGRNGVTAWTGHG